MNFARVALTRALFSRRQFSSAELVDITPKCAKVSIALSRSAFACGSTARSAHSARNTFAALFRLHVRCAALIPTRFRVFPFFSVSRSDYKMRLAPESF